MGKLKTNKAAKKRYSLTATGKFQMRGKNSTTKSRMYITTTITSETNKLLLSPQASGCPSKPK